MSIVCPGERQDVFVDIKQPFVTSGCDINGCMYAGKTVEGNRIDTPHGLSAQ